MSDSDLVRSSDSDLVTLYSGRILALAADIAHLGRLPAPTGTARKRSPLCGSMVTVDVVMKDGRVVDFGQDVKACALGQASAAILGEVILGRSLGGRARDAARHVERQWRGARSPVSRLRSINPSARV